MHGIKVFEIRESKVCGIKFDKDWDIGLLLLRDEDF